MEKSTDELPNDVISYIFSKLNMKDLVKTSTLSKQWLHEWGLRKNLNFDLKNMFNLDYKYDDDTKVMIDQDDQIISTTLPIFKSLQSEFATRLDQFMFHYQGLNISSIRVNFPLCDAHTSIVARLISQGIAKGAQRIELLFSYKSTIIIDGIPIKTNYDLVMRRIKRCSFSLTLLSSHTNSLKYLHLQNCLLVDTMEFSGLKNLTTLLLHLVDLNQDFLHGLFSNCLHLRDLTIDDCRLGDECINIVTPTLSHLKIIYDGNGIAVDIHIFASNLSSFEYSSFTHARHNIQIMEAPKLSKFSYKGSIMPTPSIDFSGLIFKNVTTIVLDSLRQPCDDMMPLMFSGCLQLEDVTFKDCTFGYNLKIVSLKLRRLKIINCGICVHNRGSRLPKKLYIDAFNLSSFEYDCHMMIPYIKAPSLLKLSWNATMRVRKKCPFDVIASLHNLQNLAMVITYSQIAKLPRALGALQNLRQVEFFIEGACNPDSDYFPILDIAMVSIHLQKLSLTVRNSHLKNSLVVAFGEQRRENQKFVHNELKYVELHGCVSNPNVIELARCLLRNVRSLKKITFSSQGCACFDSHMIHEVLKDEVKQCQLIIL